MQRRKMESREEEGGRPHWSYVVYEGSVQVTVPATTQQEAP